MQQVHEIEMPKRTYIGPGCLEEIGKDLQKGEGAKCLIITDSFLSMSRAGTELKRVIRSAGAEFIVYEGVVPNPSIDTVTAGVQMFCDMGADILISLGGGSAHDCAKAMKLVLSKKRVAEKRKIKFIAVNTTAGTGSEVTKFAIITDEEKHTKMSLIASVLLPDIAVNDACLMIDMPPGLTAQTGMDALTHAIESYVSVGANPFTRANAAGAIELIVRYLYRAYADGQDIEARDGMAYAQYMAGIAFSNSGLGMVHAMAHQLGGMYQLPHGLCNAVLLPYIVDFNQETCPERYGEIMDIIQPGGISSNAVKGKRLTRYLCELNQRLKIPKKIKIETYKKSDTKVMAVMASEDPSMAYNPRIPSQDETMEIYQTIIE